MKTKVMNNANKPAAEPRRGREAAGHVRHSHAAGPRHLGRGAGWWRGGEPPFRVPPEAPSPLGSAPPPLGGGSAALGNFRRASRADFRRPGPAGLYVCRAGRACAAAAAILRCLRAALPSGQLCPPPCGPALRPPPRRAPRGAGGEPGGKGGEEGKKGKGRQNAAGGGRGSAEEERVPPVIKGEEAEGEGRACGAEPPPETARHGGRRERLPACLPGSPGLPPSFSWTPSPGCRFSSLLLPSLGSPK